MGCLVYVLRPETQGAQRERTQSGVSDLGLALSREQHVPCWRSLVSPPGAAAAHACAASATRTALDVKVHYGGLVQVGHAERDVHGYHVTPASQSSTAVRKMQPSAPARPCSPRVWQAAATSARPHSTRQVGHNMHGVRQPHAVCAACRTALTDTALQKAPVQPAQLLLLLWVFQGRGEVLSHQFLDHVELAGRPGTLLRTGPRLVTCRHTWFISAG